MPRQRTDWKATPIQSGDLASAVSLAVDLLTRAPMPGSNLRTVLEILAKGLQCHGAYVLDLTNGSSRPQGTPTYSQLVIHSWQQDESRPGWYDDRASDRLLERWRKRLEARRDRAIAIGNTAETAGGKGQERSQLLAAGIKALLLLPIWWQGALIGLIGFEDKEAPRPWDADAIMLLSMLTPAFGAMLTSRRQTSVPENEALFRQWLDTIGDGYFEIDLNGRLILYNKALARILGYPKDALAGMHYRRYMKKEDAQRMGKVFQQIAATGEAVRGLEFAVFTSTGKTVQVEASASPIKTPDGTPTGFHGIIQDVTKRKETEVAMRRLAFQDNLTGLMNRTALEEELAKAIGEAQATEGSLAILFIDLDQFKLINDALGHAAGDNCLQAVARRMKDSLREGDIIARFGGDEFVVLLRNIFAREQILQVIRRLAQNVSKPWSYGGYEFSLTLSIGVALFPEDGQDANLLLRLADNAMYQAKEQTGISSYRFTTPAETATSFQLLMQEKRLRQALQKDQFVLHYQPKVRLADGAITGVEALLRWQDPARGFVFPGDFVPLAERTGFIIDLKTWELQAVCKQAAKLAAAGLGNILVATNLSSSQLHRGDLPQTVSNLLQEYNLDPAQLEFQLSEKAAVQDITSTGDVLRELRYLGVRLTLTNFGASYCSLSQLQDLPVHGLKLDPSFLADIGLPSQQWAMPQSQTAAKTAYSAAVIRAITVMGRSLGLTVIANGTQSQQQAVFLKHIGCHEIQGSFFSEPLPASSLLSLLERAPRPLLPTDPPVGAKIDEAT